jgi:hypothetical protein
VQTLRAEDMRPSQRRLKACLSDMDQCDTAVAFEAAHLQSIQMLIRQAPVRLGRLHQCVGEREGGICCPALAVWHLRLDA